MGEAELDPTTAEEGGAEPHASGPMARWGFAVVAAVALAALFWPRGEDERLNLQTFRKARKGQAAPAGMLIDSGGRPIPLATRMAPVTLVHFWSTWCPPCIDEIPSILRLADSYAGNHDFALVMIAVQDEFEKVQTFLGERVSESLFDHDWKVSHSYGTAKLPETHLVVGGKIIESFIGTTNWDARDNRQVIEEALAGTRESENAVGG